MQSLLVSDWAFTPPQIPGLVAWLDASSTNSMLDASDAVVTDGTRVKTWKDKSGLGNDFTQATSTARPTYRATAGGPPSIEFFSTGVFEALAHATNSSFVYSAFTSLSVIKWKTTGGTQSVFSKYNTTGNQREFAVTINGTPLLILQSSTDGTSGTVTNATDSITTPGTSNLYLLTGTWNSATPLKKIQVNLDAGGTSTPASIFAGTSDVVIGSTGTENTQPYKGYIMEQLFYNGVVSAANLSHFADIRHQQVGYTMINRSEGIWQ